MSPLDGIGNQARQVVGHLVGQGDMALLPARARQTRPLVVLVAIMCTLGCLSALVAVAGFRVADAWTLDLRSAMTILVEEPRDDAALTRAVSLVSSIEGVTAASPLGREEAKQLLRNYGANVGPLIDELPVPRLIEVSIDASNEGVANRLLTTLEGAGFTASVDDHSRYAAEILRTSALLRVAALATLLALIAAAVSSIVLAARAALQTRRDAVEIMHMVGAEDAYIADEVQARFLRLGLLAGGAGAVAAALIALVVGLVLAFGATDMTGGGSLFRWHDAWVLLVAPVVTATASAIAARLAARETLRELA